MSGGRRILVWDLPLRAFHWSLVLLGLFSFVTGKIGGGSVLEWHMRSGFAILVLLLFRIAWGFVGSPTARFPSFVRGPARAWTYARELFMQRRSEFLGHNPLGGWMVIVLLALFLLQAASGLFVEDEVSTQGPLAVKVSNAWVARFSAFHQWNSWVVAAAALFHVFAVAVYRSVFNVRLASSMVTGWRNVEETDARSSIRPASSLLALAIVAAASTLVYLLVVTYPRSA